MKKRHLFQNLIFLILFSFTSSLLISQGSVSATYSAGDIPTGYNGGNWDPACNGANTVLSVVLPTGFGFDVTGIDITYDMVANSNLWMSGQNSQIHCQNTSTSEATVSEGTGDEYGTENYTRVNVDIANGNYSGGSSLNFEMRAWRSYTTSAPGCSTVTGNVANGTWTITVHYGPEITPPRVGINNSNPKATLDVGGEIIIGDNGNPAEAGMIKFTSGKFMANDGANEFSINPNSIQDFSQLGINTDTPEATLDVNGSVKISVNQEAINNPEIGMIIFDQGEFTGYDGNEWKVLTIPDEIASITSQEKEESINLPFNNFVSPSNSIIHYTHTPTGRWVLDGSALSSALNIPVGSNITEITLYYYDNSSAQNARLRLYRYLNGSIDIPAIIFSVTGGNPPSTNIHTLSTTANLTIDQSYSYYLTFTNGNSGDVRIRSVSLKYTKAIFD